MPKRNHEKEIKLKTNVGGLVGPLLKTLKSAKEHLADDSFTKKTIANIAEHVDEIKSFVDQRQRWDSELIGCFGKIEREIDYWAENKNRKTETNEFTEIIIRLESQVKHLVKKQIANPQIIGLNFLEEESDWASKGMIHEIGESSNCSDKADNDSLGELMECMKNLSPQLTDCLYSLAIFPEKTRLKKRLLIYWWIGLRLIPLQENTPVEQLGNVFFHDLVHQGILIPVHIREHNRTIDQCTIKPTIHKKLISYCKSIPLLRYWESAEGTFCFCSDVMSNERALLNLNQKYLNSKDIICKDVWDNNRSLQVIQFGMWHCTELRVHSGVKVIGSKETNSLDHIEVDVTDFLKNIGERVTYLSLQGISRVEEIPQNVGKLEDLMILDLRSCHNLEKLPEKPKLKLQNIFRVPLRKKKWFNNLIHLDMSECHLLDYMPKWLCELSNLEVLKGFVAGIARNGNQFCRLGDLSKLKKLRKLSIKISKHLDTDDISGLKPLDNLLVLTIIWSIKDQTNLSNDPSNETQVVDEEKITEMENQRRNKVQEKIVEAEKKSREHLHESVNISKGVEIRDVSRSKTIKAKNGDKKISGVKEDKMAVEEKQSRENVAHIQKEGDNKDNQKILTISFPKNLEKLDIRCYPHTEAPELLNPAKLKKLKRLYIRGGNLTTIKDDAGWEVEILRLRFLKFLDFDWYDLSGIFTKLQCVQYEKCPMLLNFPTNRSVWVRDKDGPFLSRRVENSVEPMRAELILNHKKIVPLEKKYLKVILKLTGASYIQVRASLDVVAVLDVNQMMEGDKLESLKTAILLLIHKLNSNDRLSIVTFGTEARTLCGLQQVSADTVRRLEHLIRNLEPEGYTNIFDGLQMGWKVIMGRSSSSSNRHPAIILMSGSAPIACFGNPSHVQIDNAAVHTIGFGEDFDPRVLMSIANNSMEGTFSDVRNLNNLNQALNVFLDRLLVMVAEDLTLTIKQFDNESIIVNVSVGAYQQTKNADGSITVKFGNLYSGKVHAVLVDLHLPDTDKKRYADVLEASYSYKFSGVHSEVPPKIVHILRTLDMMVESAPENANESGTEDCSYTSMDHYDFLKAWNTYII